MPERPRWSLSKFAGKRPGDTGEYGEKRGEDRARVMPPFRPLPSGRRVTFLMPLTVTGRQTQEWMCPVVRFCITYSTVWRTATPYRGLRPHLHQIREVVCARTVSAGRVETACFCGLPVISKTVGKQLSPSQSTRVKTNAAPVV